MPLEKARLMEIEADENARTVPGSEIAVQFNPASLKLALANKVQSQETLGQQPRQYLGKTSTTLSFDLEFDTSDEGSTGSPVSVRTRTAAIERFVQPKSSGKEKQRPPKARFIWHDLRLDGIIEDLAIDFTLFASDGTPLRAKMSITMKEQDAKYQMGKLGPGANSGAGVSLPGGISAGIGFSASVGVNASAGVSVGLSAGVSIGASLTDSTRVALSGESAAEFATRNGLDPAAWRGVTGAQGSSLSLQGGAEVDFNSSLSVGSGVGVSVGVELGTSASPEARTGLDVRSAVPTPAGIALQTVGASSGFALAAVGGVSAAIETVNGLKAGAAAAASRASFAAPAAQGSAAVPPSREPLVRTGLPSATMQSAAPSAPPPPVADARAASFGLGVPLRDAITGAAAARRDALRGAIPLRAFRSTDTLTPAADPTSAPWTHLPADRARGVADAEQRNRFPLRRCGCAGPCTHRNAQ